MNDILLRPNPHEPTLEHRGAGNERRPIRVLGVPIDLGANMRGANMAPAAIRIAELHHKIGILGYKIVDDGDLIVPIRDTLADTDAHAHFLPQIVAICRKLDQWVYQALKAGHKPVALGGDHCIASGTIAGASRYFAEKNERVGVIWIDAHADMNTPESTLTGNIHGMPLATLLGHGHPDLVGLGIGGAKVDPKNVALIGIRVLDGPERQILKDSGVRYFTMREIDERGMHEVMTEAIQVASKGTAGIHLSFDIDGIDPLYAPGVSTPSTGGISYREAHLLLEMLADTGLLRSMEFVELNPMTDLGHKTAQLATELIQSALGKVIV